MEERSNLATQQVPALRRLDSKHLVALKDKTATVRARQERPTLNTTTDTVHQSGRTPHHNTTKTLHGQSKSTGESKKTTGAAQNLNAGTLMKSSNDELVRNRKTENITILCLKPASHWRSKKSVVAVTTAMTNTLQQDLHRQRLLLAKTAKQDLSCPSVAYKPKGPRPHRLDNKRIRLRSWPHLMDHQHMELSSHLLPTGKRHHSPASLLVLVTTRSNCLPARSNRSMSPPSSLRERPRTTTSRRRRPLPRRSPPRSRRRPA